MANVRKLIACLAAVALIPAVGNAQATGTITGTVREAETGRPLAQARVSVVGTSIMVPTRDDGGFTLRGVSPGSVQVRASAIGHRAEVRTVTLAPAGTATVNFSLAVAAVQLEEVVTTATGLSRRVEQGNDIPRIDAAELVAERPIANMADLLTGRAAGVQVIPGTTTGTQSRVRVRGASSLSLSNDPIYIIDGIRMEAASASSVIGVGGAIPNRVNDIDPEQIESIEVVKGPSAATLYGTDAANGVIVITTKKGRAGRARWTTYIERGRLTDENEYPTAYTLFGHSPGATTARVCTLTQVNAGTCIADSLASFNLFEDPETTPFAPGDRQQYGMQVSGGTEALRYFVSGEYEEEIGTHTIPQFDLERLRSCTANGVPLPNCTPVTRIPFKHLRPNALERSSFRANANMAVSPKVDLAVASAYIALTQRRPQTDNNTTGLMSSAMGGPGFRNNGISGNGFPLNGYRVFTPGDMFQDEVDQDVNRFIGSVSPQWRPLSWLTTRGNFGLDFTNRVDSELCRRENCSNFGTSREGFRFQYRTNFFQYTADGSATASFTITPALTSKSSLGYQYFRRTFHRNGAEATNLPPGTQTVTAGAVKGADETTTYNITAGGFLQQEFAWNERLFFNAAVRGDKNTAFGSNFETIWYPKAHLSWLASSEPFFPTVPFLNELRLRIAYGASGRAPSANDAVQFFAARTGNIADVGTPGVQFSALGNPDLKPERARELEGGFDLAMFDNRASLALTLYDKITKDALIEVPIPGSVGAGFSSGGTSTRAANVGSTRNNGWEASFRGVVLNRDVISSDFTFNYSHNKNKILRLHEGRPIVVGTQIQHREGLPLFGYYQVPIRSFSDANGNGIISLNEIVIGDTLEFHGPSLPTREWSFNPAVELFRRAVRLTASIDHKGGHTLLNATERIRCQNRANCRAISDINAPLWDQARAVALREHGSRTQWGYLEKGDYTKLREVSLTWTPSARFVGSRFADNRLSLTVAARNLKTWTDYSGTDPESAYFEGGGTGNDIQTDFQTAAPARYVTFRLNVGF